MRYIGRKQKDIPDSSGHVGEGCFRKFFGRKDNAVWDVIGEDVMGEDHKDADDWLDLCCHHYSGSQGCCCVLQRSDSEK